RRAQPVDAETPRQLGQPGTNGRVVSKPVEILVRAREDFLEDVLGVCLRQPESLYGNRVDVAREPFDQLGPGLLVARPTACHELTIAERRRHSWDCDVLRGGRLFHV